MEQQAETVECMWSNCRAPRVSDDFCAEHEAIAEAQRVKRAAEQREGEARGAEFREYARGLATALGNGWKYVEPKASEPTTMYSWHVHNADLTRAKDGAGLSLSLRDGRVSVRGNYPAEDRTIGWSYSTPYDAVWPSISITASKAPIQAARDITRRLLPEYLKLYAEGCERREASRKYHDGVANAARALAARAPMMLNVAREPAREPGVLHFTSLTPLYGQLHVSERTDAEPTVKFEVDYVPMKVAAKIVSLLASVKKGDDE